MRQGKQFQFKKNVIGLGANITEGAKDLVGNIGEGLKNLSK
ncbi:MAG: hypothetical protein ACM3VV_08350 [Deltaproteobacteria bacterium]|nr:hypothetical protein [Nitrososphaeraceae archaeon]